MKILYKILRYLGYSMIVFLLLLIASILILFANKEKLWQSAQRQMSMSLKSKLEIESIGLAFPNHFPNLTLSISNLKITDSTSHSEVLQIGNLKADLDLVSVITFHPKIHALQIENAKLKLITDKDGKLNFSLLNYDTSSKELKDSTVKPISLHFEIPLDKIVLQNVSIQIKDSSQFKQISLNAVNTSILINQIDKETNIAIDGAVYIEKLGFNTKLGSFLKKKTVDAHIKALIPEKEEALLFLPSYVIIDGERYEVKGFFKPGILPDVNLIISTDHAVVSKVLECLTENVAAQIEPYKVKNTVHAIITISGPLKPNEDPKIDLRFWSEKNEFRYKNLPFIVSKINFEGIVCNHVDPNKPSGDPNTSFIIKDVSGKIGFGDLKAQVSILNLINPKIDLKANLSMNLANIADSIPNSPFEKLTGLAKINLDYKGTIPKGKELSLLSNWNYHGTIDFDKIGFKTGGIDYKNIHGRLLLHNDTVALPVGFGFEIAGNKVSVSGHFYNPIKHFLMPDTLLEAYLKISSPYFNINSLMVKSDKRQTATKTKPKKSFKEVHKALQNMRFVIALDFKEALFRKLKIENLKGEFYRQDDLMALKNMKMETSGGFMQIDIKADHLDTDHQTGTADIKIKNLDVEQLFYGMNNFDQNTIVSKQLEGKFNAVIQFTTNFKDGYQVIPQTMRGQFNFQLYNGHLKNFVPLQNVSKFIFRRRDFTDIHFEELTQTATLNGKTLEISDMKIQSNVITLFVNGSYSFDNIVNLKIRIPWFNLKRKEDYLADIEKDQSKASALHIKAYTKNGKLTFGLGR